VYSENTLLHFKGRIMSRVFQVTMRWAVLALVMTIQWTVFAPRSPAQEFQKVPVVLHARDVLPRDLLTGPNYTVRNRVINDGLFNVYDVDTFYGPLKVKSTALLLKRIGELNAINRIDQMEGSDVYMNALKQAGVAPLKTAGEFGTDPVGTVSDVAAGIGRFFSNVVRSVTSTDPYQPAAGEAILGQAAYKRQFAFQFGVDPYSSYAPLQTALDDLSWTATAGGLTVKAAVMAIPGLVGTVVGAVGTAQSLKALVSEKAPSQLEEINRGKLFGLGVPDYLVQRLLNNVSYDPQEMTLLVGAVADMVGVMTPAVYVRKAAGVHDESMALFMRVRAQLMDLYKEKYGSVAAFVDAGGSTFLATKRGKIIGIFPLDYVVWTARLARKEAEISRAIEALPGVTAKELWFTGKVDAAARSALEQRAWKVEDNIQGRLLQKVNY
jgi:hypothetical protein